MAAIERYNHHSSQPFADVETVCHIATPLLRSVFGHAVSLDQWELLKGGYRNLNYGVVADGTACVVRLIAAGEPVARKEAALLSFLAQQNIAVPQLLAFDLAAGMPVMSVLLLKRAEGTLLSRWLESPAASSASETNRPREVTLGNALGRELAHLHQLSIPRDVQPLLLEGMPSRETFCDEARDLVLTLLDGRAGTRLGADISRRTQQLVAAQWSLVEATYCGGSLVHADYNPKNIFVASADDPSPPAVTAILDWEFACVGHPLIDLGNFLRFESEDYTPALAEAFEAGYERGGGPLAASWRLASRLLDLVSMAQFLSRAEDLPLTFATARGVVRSTLATFDAC